MKHTYIHIQILTIAALCVISASVPMMGKIREVHDTMPIITSRTTQEKETDTSWQAFKTLVLLLSNEQKSTPSQALQVCQQKLAKGTRIPREFNDLLPEICMYIENITYNQIAQEQERTLKSIALLADMKTSLAELRSIVEHSMGTLHNNENARGNEAAFTSDCQSMGIRQILCQLDDKLTIVLDHIKDSIEINQNSINTISSTVDQNNQFIHKTLGAFMQQSLNAIEAIKLTVNTNNKLMTDTISSAMNTNITQVQMIKTTTGTIDQHSNQIHTINDIDAQHMSIIEWLKTISRQLLKVDCLLHSDCWASCIDTCDI